MFRDLETERLLLRSISCDDAEFFFREFSNDDVNRYLYDAEPCASEDEARQWIDFYLETEPRNQHRWILVSKKTGEKMGTCGFHCMNSVTGETETGYDLLPEYRGMGYMHEAMKVILAFIRSEYFVSRVYAHIAEGNAASVRTAVRLGFTKTYDSYFKEFHGQKYLHNVYMLKMSGADRNSLMAELDGFEPFNEQEAADRVFILTMLRNESDLYLRSNLAAHMTASAWVVNPSRTKVLMCYHNIYRSWSWLGGHADGCEDLRQVALREVTEESGITNPRIAHDGIFSVEVLTVDGHVKKGRYVSSHLHLNVTYLIEADEEENLSVKADENSGVRWFTLNEAVAASTEPWFRERIYTKLNCKLAEMRV